MKSKINIQSYPNFLTDQEQSYVITKTLMGSTWKFGAVSDKSGFMFWFMDLMQDVFFTEHMLNKIKITTKKIFALDRVYANGQTYGLSGTYHQDKADNSYRTFLYYVNLNWKSEWGGSTLFKQNEEVYIQPFVSNNAILFDSTLYHVGLEPTRHCNDLRVTVAFKLKYISDIEEI